MVTHNAETWVNMTRKTERMLDGLFHSFCNSIMRIGNGVPRPGYYWQSGFQPFGSIILSKKLMFAFHLSNLFPSSLARQIWESQLENKNLPGLAREVEEHIQKIGVLDLKTISKWKWRSLVNKYVLERTRLSLLEEIKGYKKLSYAADLSREKFERKAYFS